MPVTKENEQAAIALIGFKDDPEIAKVCLQMLQENITDKPIFSAYLVMGCHGLNDPKDQEEFIQMSQRPTSLLIFDKRWMSLLKNLQKNFSHSI